jgi:hypothetical protein
VDWGEVASAKRVVRSSALVPRVQCPGWKVCARNRSACQRGAPGAWPFQRGGGDGAARASHRIRAEPRSRRAPSRTSHSGTPCFSAARLNRREAVKSSARGLPAISPTTNARSRQRSPSSSANSASSGLSAATWSRRWRKAAAPRGKAARPAGARPCPAPTARAADRPRACDRPSASDRNRPLAGPRPGRPDRLLRRGSAQKPAPVRRRWLPLRRQRFRCDGNRSPAPEPSGLRSARPAPAGPEPARARVSRRYLRRKMGVLMPCESPCCSYYVPFCRIRNRLSGNVPDHLSPLWITGNQAPDSPFPKQSHSRKVRTCSTATANPMS